MTSLMAFGFVLGLKHALEPDHMAAVAALASRQQNPMLGALHGALWGLGHSLTLLLIAGACIAFGIVLSEPLAAGLEALVGLALMALGARVVWLAWHERDGHRHDPESTTSHTHILPWHSAAMGLLHGMAGSAALIVLTAQVADTAGAQLAYVAIVGVGAMTGMAALAALLLVPATHRSLEKWKVQRWLSYAAGIGSMVVGGPLVWMFIVSNPLGA